MISPSTSRKITTAIRKTIVYRSRICAPCAVTATGGKSPVTNVSPACRTLPPKATSSRTMPMMAAPRARATTAVLVVRDLGELDIKILEMGGEPVRGASTGESAGASDRRGAEPRPFYSERARLAGRGRGAHDPGRDRPPRSCDDAADAWTALDPPVGRGVGRA